jgi:hypothetical protein
MDDANEASGDEAECTTCDGQRRVVDGDDRVVRCPDCSECPTDTTQQDHNWQHDKGVECSCTAFEVVRAALSKAGAR